MPHKNLNNYWIYLLLMCFLCSNKSIAQDFDNYQPTKAQGKLPQDLLTTSEKKYFEVINSKRIKSKTEKQFHLKNNFILDELLSSGKLLFNDPMTNYVGKVLDNILKDKPELRKKLKHYTVRSSSVNAFATDRGEIFINVGLLSKLNNEAELAFILCHEIQHFIQQHNLETYLVIDEITQKNNRYQQQRSYDNIVTIHGYTRQLEREADKLGLQFFLETDYSLSAAQGVFELLALAHVPYTNVPFDLHFFETDFIRFSNQDFLKQVNEIEPNYNEDNGTHPSIRERKEIFQQLIDDQNLEISKGKKFIQPKSEFDKIQKIARFDLPDILVASNLFVKAIYHSYALLQEYPANSYAEKNIAKALYGIAQMSNKTKRSDSWKFFDEYIDYKDNHISRAYRIQGELHRLFYLFNEMDYREVNMWAARYCYELSLKYPEDKSLLYRTQDMVEDIVLIINSPEQYFETEKLDVDEMGDLSFAPYVFADILNDDTFNKWVEQGKVNRAKFIKEENITPLQKRRKERRELRKGISMGIDTAVFVNPIYVAMTIRNKKEPIKHIKSEQRQLKLKNWIETLSDKIGLTAQVLDIEHIKSQNAIDNYNEIVTINRAAEELMSNEVTMITSNYDDLMPIMEKYQTSVFVYSGVISFKDASLWPLGIPMIGLSSIMVGLPPSIIMLLLENYQSAYYTYIIDFKQNTVIHSEFNLMPYQKARDGVIKNNIYWTLFQMNRKPKK